MVGPSEVPTCGHRVFYGVESWSGVLEWSIGVEWSQSLEWQMLLLFSHKIESSCDVCVCGRFICYLLIVMHQ